MNSFKSMRNAIKSITICIWLSASFSQLQGQTLNKQKLDSLFDRLSADNQAMGTFAIAKNGNVLYSRSIGYSLISGDKKIKNDANTQFMIGSVSKMFTATMIFQLIDEHKLSLDTKLSKYFPKIPAASEITIGTLLSHKSGLFDFVNDISDRSFLTKPQSRSKILSYIQYGQRHFAPNTDQLYSNSGYLLLASIIEKITKQKYSQQLQERICKRLNLTKTFSPTARNLGTTKSYYFNGTWNEIADLYPPNITGVGDIVSTPTEMIVFIDALFNDKLISSKSVNMMKKSAGPAHGMGLMKVPFGEKLGYGHGGDTYGTHSLVASFEKDSLTLAFSDNGENYPHNDIAIAMLSIYFNQPFTMPDFCELNYTAAQLGAYSGRYASEQIPLEITVTQKDNKLSAQAAGQSSFPLKSSEKNKFHFRSANLELEFNPEKGEMLLKQHGKSYLYHKETKK
ncbi:serine hydrolase domain-containing protein [Pedobacter endophyticus]|uniref:Beta-lactamase family protein n=1 Tax=Pedobacter endophyticus TaxID=2789740 RepID=A0A7U3Q3I5_9SPHI|nr:serine hydrolase domain-containing protein [Pedobacter endophyticus]QPH37679.1 beta-lactamase family protein [Pedobacter endophyticus]